MEIQELLVKQEPSCAGDTVCNKISTLWLLNGTVSLNHSK